MVRRQTARGTGSIRVEIYSKLSVVLQLSGLLAGGVKESRNDNPTGNLSNGGRPNPASSFVQSGGIFAAL